MNKLEAAKKLLLEVSEGDDTESIRNGEPPTPVVVTAKHLGVAETEIAEWADREFNRIIETCAQRGTTDVEVVIKVALVSGLQHGVYAMKEVEV